MDVSDKGVMTRKSRNRMTHALTLKIALVMFTAILIIFASTVSGATVGVQKDEWAKYGDFSASWTGQKPPGIDEFANTEWAKVTVQSISGTTVTVESITHYKNGTEKTTTESGDIATGSGDLSFFIIPANLGRGDVIPLNVSGVPGGVSPVINDTVTRTYAGAQREVNYWGYYVSNVSAVYNFTADFDIYWDKAKGVLCELSMSISTSVSTPYLNYTISYAMRMKINETSMWAGGIIPGVPNYMLYIIIAVVAIVIIVAAVFVMRKRKAPTPTITPSREKEPTAAPSKEEG